LGVSGTIVKTMSACCATSRPLRQAVAPACTISAGTERAEYTNSRCPAFRRWPAIGVPMMPRPMKPSLRFEVVIGLVR
jgi:hypothetical protein